MAGTTLFTVSRTLAEWRRAGIVEASGGRLVVRDPAALPGVVLSALLFAGCAALLGFIRRWDRRRR